MQVNLKTCMVSLKVYMYIRVDLLCIFKFIRSAHCHQLLEFISDMKEYIILRFHPQDKTKGNIADQFRGFPHSSVGKESACHVGNLGSIPGLGRSPGVRDRYPLQYFWASLVAQLVKNLPPMWETWVRSLGWEDLLEKGKAATSVFWPGESRALYSLKASDKNERLSRSLSFCDYTIVPNVWIMNQTQSYACVVIQLY